MDASARHLLGIRGLGREDIARILRRAQALKQARRDRTVPPVLTDVVVATLFFEDSTRTRASFEIAAQSLGAKILSWSAKGSSAAKGETLIDTVRNIDAMGPGILVLRHPSSGAAALAAKHVRAAVVNAGDGTHEHPSQALLDALTLQERLGDLAGKRILIVGDILHSRVARSNLHCLNALGAEVTVCGPATLLPRGIETLGARTSWHLDAELPQADAVMMLRIQLERQQQALFPSQREYARLYGLNAARVARMKPQAIILHPGPVNRGVEISHDALDDPRSVILEQVENGVAVRMAILERSGA